MLNCALWDFEPQPYPAFALLSMTTTQTSAPARLDARRVLQKAQRIARAKLDLAPVWTGADQADTDWSTTIAHLRRQLEEVETAAGELEKEESKIRGVLQGQNKVVEECLAAALATFPSQANRINLVNRAFSNAGLMRRLQLRAISWEKIWETLDPEWQPSPGLTLRSFRERRLKLESDSADAGKVWMKWRLADEMCQAMAARLEQDCVKWATEAQRRFPADTHHGRMVGQSIFAV